MEDMLHSFGCCIYKWHVDIFYDFIRWLEWSGNTNWSLCFLVCFCDLFFNIFVTSNPTILKQQIDRHFGWTSYFHSIFSESKQIHHFLSIFVETFNLFTVTYRKFGVFFLLRKDGFVNETNSLTKALLSMQGELRSISVSRDGWRWWCSWYVILMTKWWFTKGICPPQKWPNNSCSCLGVYSKNQDEKPQFFCHPERLV